MLMTETPDLSMKGKAKLLEIAFETFNIPSLFLAQAPLMSLFAVGKISGVVVDIGNRGQIYPVMQGYVSANSTYSLTRGIGDLNEYFAQLIQQRVKISNKTIAELIQFFRDSMHPHSPNSMQSDV